MALASQKVLRWLVKYIQTQKLEKGSVLPAETEISQMLNLSRVPVREAYASLKAFGVARSQQGVGLILTADPRRLDMMMLFSAEKLNVADYYQVRQFRDFLEIGAVDEIIDNAKPRDIKAMGILIDRLEGKSTPAISPEDFEIEFHKYLAKLSRNRFFIAISLLYEQLFEKMIEVGKSATSRHGILPKAIEDHREIVKAIKDKKRNSLLKIFRIQSDCLKMEMNKNR